MIFSGIWYTKLGILYDFLRKFLRSSMPDCKSVSYITFSELLSHKKSDILFIIGSGTSINRYTRREKSEIDSNDSLSINYGMMYGIHSTYHMFELGESKRVNSNELMLHNLNLFHTISPNTCLLLQAGVRGKSIISKLPNSHREYIHVISNLFMPIKNEDLLPDCMQLIEKLKHFLNKSNRYLYFSKRASIFSAIQIAYDLGYKKIVLCGVELNNDNYFYEELREEYEQLGYSVPIVNHSPKNVHKTNDIAYGSITVQKLIENYNNEVLIPNNVKLYVAKPNSVLYPQVENYWNN